MPPSQQTTTDIRPPPFLLRGGDKREPSKMRQTRKVFDSSFELTKTVIGISGTTTWESGWLGTFRSGGLTRRCRPTRGISVLSFGLSGGVSVASANHPALSPVRLSVHLFYRLRPGATQALDRLAALRAGATALRPSPVAPPVERGGGASPLAAVPVAPCGVSAPPLGSDGAVGWQRFLRHSVSRANIGGRGR